MTLATDVMLPNVIARRAREEPDRIFIGEVGDSIYSYGEVWEHAQRWARAFLDMGLGPGDRVLTMLPPCEEWLAAWLGLATIRAVEAGVNTDYKGAILEYAIRRAEPRALVIAGEHLGKLTDDMLSGSGLELIIIVNGKTPDLPPVIPTTTSADFLPPAADDIGTPPVEAWDTACMILTSGTTGPSKYVVVPWGLLYSGATGTFPVSDITPDDNYYLPIPVYHAGARYCLYLMALAGGSVTFRDRFSASDFWADVAAHGCTLSVVAWFAKALWDLPPDPNDANTPLRAVLMGPIAPFYREFAERFGVRVCTAYGMSEIGLPIGNVWDPPNHRTCGRARTDALGLEIRLVDEHDREVPSGEVGELIVRSTEPWTITPGYFRMPEETAHAWRNGWFHTGDGFKIDAEGNLYFVDRIKDAIRRRGENISSFEVEAIANSHPSVAESAAIGVASPHGEDEILLYVVRRSGDISEEAFIEFMAQRAPKFLVPRYIEFIDDLPKTEATLRVKKAELRRRGVSAATWERPLRREARRTE